MVQGCLRQPLLIQPPEPSRFFAGIKAHHSNPRLDEAREGARFRSIGTFHDDLAIWLVLVSNELNHPFFFLGVGEG